MKAVSWLSTNTAPSSLSLDVCLKRDLQCFVYRAEAKISPVYELRQSIHLLDVQNNTHDTATDGAYTRFTLHTDQRETH